MQVRILKLKNKTIKIIYNKEIRKKINNNNYNNNNLIKIKIKIVQLIRKISINSNNKIIKFRMIKIHNRISHDN